jgi:phospholipase C
MRLLLRLRRLLTRAQGKLVEAAADVTVPGSAGLSDIRHVVILMQENRSFDHCYLQLRSVTGDMTIALALARPTPRSRRCPRPAGAM